MNKWLLAFGGGLGAWLLFRKKAEAQAPLVIPGVSTKSTYVFTFEAADVTRFASAVETNKAEINLAASNCLLNGKMIGWSTRPTGTGSFFVDVVFEYDGTLTATPAEINRCLDKQL